MMILWTLLAFASLPIANPFLGNWSLDAAKSIYTTGTSPKSMVIKMDAAPGGAVLYQSETIYLNGRRSTSRYTAAYDGREAVVTGLSGLQAPVSLKQLDANTVEATYRTSLRVVATSVRTISNGGQTMTIKTVSKDRTGKTVTNIGIYSRVR